jgi:hypothetical protein
MAAMTRAIAAVRPVRSAPRVGSVARAVVPFRGHGIWSVLDASSVSSGAGVASGPVVVWVGAGGACPALLCVSVVVVCPLVRRVWRVGFGVRCGLFAGVMCWL